LTSVALKLLTTTLSIQRPLQAGKNFSLDKCAVMMKEIVIFFIPLVGEYKLECQIKIIKSSLLHL